MLVCKRSQVANTIRKILAQRAENGLVILHTKQVHRLIADGDGSCSADRYIRALRQAGEIDYPDPRSKKGYYIIMLLAPFYKKLQEAK